MSDAIKIYQGRFGRVALLKMDASLVTHAHHQCHLLLKAGGSDGAFRVGSTRVPLTDESTVLVNAWEQHAYVHEAPAGQSTLILALYLQPTWLAELHGGLALSSHNRFFSQSGIRVSSRARKLIQEFVMEIWFDDALTQLRLEELIIDLLMSSLEALPDWKSVSGSLRTKPSAAIDPRIRRAIAWMRSDLSRDIDVEKLASLCGMSRAQFHAVFRRDVNVTPLVYSNVLRVESAIHRLATGRAPIADVAAELGFSEQSHFTRFFRQHIGVPPTDYRRIVQTFDNDAYQFG